MNTLQTILGAVEPYLLELIAMLVGTIIARAATTASTRWGLDIEQRHRDALHSAVMSAVRAAVGRGIYIAPDGEPCIGDDDCSDDLFDDTIDYVKKSVPDAVRALRPTDDVIRTLAASAITRLAS